MVKGGLKRQDSEVKREEEYRFVHTNLDLIGIIQTAPLREEIFVQRMRYYGHVCRRDNLSITKRMIFAKPKKLYYRDPWKKLSSHIRIEGDQLLRMTQSQKQDKDVIHRMISTLERRVR